MHNHGYKTANRHFKLFTFALRLKKFSIVPDAFKLDRPQADLIISSPMIHPFFNNFLEGTFEHNTIEIANHQYKCCFKISSVEILPDIELSTTEHFTLLTPMVLSIQKDREVLPAYYLRPMDILEANRILQTNLCRKYFLVNNKEYTGSGISFKWDEQYLQSHKRVTKKITIEKDKPIEVVGVQAPFVIAGDPDLIRIGYECGFGEKNSMGFGMALKSNAK